MIGIELKEGYETLRNRLLFEKRIFTGGAGQMSSACFLL